MTSADVSSDTLSTEVQAGEMVATKTEDKEPAVEVGTTLRNERRPMLLVALVLFAMSLLRGIAFPHRWAATHMFFRYGEHGLVKRGLVGTLLGWLGNAGNHYNTFFAFSMVLLCGNIWLLGKWLRRMVADKDVRAPWGAVVFAAGFGPVYLGCTTGYFDQLGLLACLSIFYVRGFRRRMVATGILFGVLSFVHEGIFLMYFPVAFVACTATADFRWRRKQVFFWMGMALLLGMLTFWLGGLQLSRREALLLFRDSQLVADFKLKRDAFEVLARSGESNLRIMRRAFGNPRHWDELGFGFAVMLPGAVFTSALTWQTLKSTGLDKIRRVLLCSSPYGVLVLHTLAWDVHRWNAMMLMNCFIVYAQSLALRERDWARPASQAVDASPVDMRQSGSIAEAPRWLTPLGTLLVFLGAGSTVPMISGAPPESFPFRRHAMYIKGLALGRRAFPQVERRRTGKKAKKTAPKKKTATKKR